MVKCNECKNLYFDVNKHVSEYPEKALITKCSKKNLIIERDCREIDRECNDFKSAVKQDLARRISHAIMDSFSHLYCRSIEGSYTSILSRRLDFEKELSETIEFILEEIERDS